MKIENTSTERIVNIVEAQREFFRSGATLKRDFRKKQLKRLLEALEKWRKPLLEALWQDLHKSEQEAVLTELSIVEGEIRNHLRHLKRWMRVERCATPLKMMPSRSRIVSEKGSNTGSYPPTGSLHPSHPGHTWPEAPPDLSPDG